MTKHCIIMSSSYTEGTRIALDITDPLRMNADAVARIIDEIRDKSDQEVPLSTHFIETDSDNWESVSEYDPFFKNVKRIDSVEEFSEMIRKDRVLSGLDVANYILSVTPCTHLSLEKLVYFAYADYLCSHSDRLFEDDIWAFRHGPVVKSVYYAYKRSGYEYLHPIQYEDDTHCKSTEQMPMRSRILFAKNGLEKLSSIDKTIERYGKYSAWELAEITHRDYSPWSLTDSNSLYNTISDYTIRMAHSVECD